MEFRSDLAPPTDTPSKKPLTPPDQIEQAAGPSKFSQMLHEVEAHRNKVRAALGVALVARLLFEFNFVSLVQDSTNMLVQVPYLGFAILSYLLVLMWLAARTRDRFGFGMALGIGVLEATYLLVVAVLGGPLNLQAVWPPLVVALAHIPMAIFAFRASTAYPPQDSKRPWLVGFVTALVFLIVPWIAPTVLAGRF